MCGICGIINFNEEKVSEVQIKSMMSKMNHRGPNDNGIFIKDNIGLGFVRLSILDLSSAGHQPMFSKNGRYCIILNGEIYNYIELKLELKNKYSFTSHSDTEVVLAAFEEWGEECLNKFIGMWAFVIYDLVEKSFFIARDRFGIKPFYYYSDNNKFVFASDIPSILAVVKAGIVPNEKIIFDFLAFNRTFHSEDSFFKNIKRLLPSRCIRINNNQIKFRRWYNLSDASTEPLNNSDELRELLLSSVNLQMRSDVPVGVCLSGGLDSSSIISLIVRNFEAGNMHSFSAVYNTNHRSNESSFISEFNNYNFKMLSTYPTGDSLIDDYDDYIKALVEPLPGCSEYAEYKVMQLAKKHCTVLLNGQGVDEVLAGYLYFFGFYFKELLINYKYLSLLKNLYHYSKIHKSLEGYQSFLFFMLPAKIKSLIKISQLKYINKDLSSRYSADSSKFLVELYGSKSLKESFLNHFEYKFEHHLAWADRSGMWFSLEARFPFLDHRFIEKALTLQHTQIINKGVTKSILREAMKGIVPEKIRTRNDKVGYETPSDDWFRSKKMSELVKDIIYSPQFAGRGYINAPVAQKLYEEHLSGKRNISNEIWKWIHLESWSRMFFT